MAALSYGNVMAVLDVASVRALASQNSFTTYNGVARITTIANSASLFNQNVSFNITEIGSDTFITVGSVNPSIFAPTNFANLNKIQTYYTSNVQQRANITALGAITIGNTVGPDIFSNIYQSLAQSYTTSGVYLVGKGGLASISTGGGGGGGLTGKIESWT